jgi:hypothetical protein
VKILLGEFGAILEREDIYKLTIENESLHESSSDNGIRVVNFTTPAYNFTCCFVEMVNLVPEVKERKPFENASEKGA